VRPLGDRGEREFAPPAVGSDYGLATRLPRNGAVGRRGRGEREALDRIELPSDRREARSRGVRFFAMDSMRAKN
jgi:hypothetical protein